MKVKYNRVSTLGQSGDRFSVDREKYDLTLLDKVSGTLPFRERPKGQEVIKLVEEDKITELVVEELADLEGIREMSSEPLSFSNSMKLMCMSAILAYRADQMGRRILSGN